MVPGALTLVHSLANGSPRVAIIRALQLGDMLCAVPALRAVRAALPRAHVTLVGLPWAEEFAQRFPHYIDDFMLFPGFPGIPERTQDEACARSFLADARARRYDLAIQMHGDGRVMNAFAAELGADAVAGFRPRDAVDVPPGHLLAYPDGEPEVRRLLRLTEVLGAPARGEHLEFPVSGMDEAEAEAIHATHGLADGAYVAVHPGGRGDDRRWDPSGFSAVADALAASGLRVVLTGSAAEAPLIEAVASRMEHSPVSLAGRTSLGGLAALLRTSRLLVANDTGVSHLATALRVPSVVLFTGSDPARWAPLDRRRHRPVIAGVPGSDGPGCCRGSTDTVVGTVLAEVIDLLQASNPSASSPGAPH